jgi:2-oxoglutarate dehydrogenase E1 component
MTPKSLLRHKAAVSKAEDFLGDSFFHRVLHDDKPTAPEKVKRVVLCSGKVYYDLSDARDAAEDETVQILRVEQIYPFPADALIEAMKAFPNLETVVWAQEEPKNNGSWFFVEPLIEEVLATLGGKPTRPLYAGRKASAATATGLAKNHVKQQAALVAEALGYQA